VTVSTSLHDVLHSTGFTIARNLALFFVVLFWLGLAYWTHRDAKRRIDDPLLVGTATLLGLVPFIGPLVYLLFRPPETLEEAKIRHVEVRALEARLVQRQPLCPVCRTTVEESFLICPVCTTQLKRPCAACSAPLEQLWQACPHCMTPVTRQRPAAELDAALAAEAALSGKTAVRGTRATRPRRRAAS
jgi:hypothetical protein